LSDDNITRFIKSFNLGELLDSPDSGSDLPLQPNDIVRIYSKDIFISSKTVSINGVVRSPGSYVLKAEMSLEDLILEAGGLNENVYRYRVEVARIDPLNNDLDEYAEIVTFNMDEKFSILSSPVNDFYLQPYDLITIRPDPYFNNQKQITISGAVLYPGSYTILSSDEKITDIIERSGGLRPNAYSFGSTFSRNGQRVQLNLQKIIKSPKSALNIVVQSGDIINIALEPQIIQIVGEVNVPGFYKFQPRKRVSDIIKMSGGLSQNAERDDIYIQYPDGTSSKYHRWLNNKKVLDGSIISIGREKEEEPFDRTEYAKELTTIFANLAQALSVMALATR
jgi:protein involved in polysaccharide export with SLBB domain